MPIVASEAVLSAVMLHINFIGLHADVQLLSELLFLELIQLVQHVASVSHSLYKTGPRPQYSTFSYSTVHFFMIDFNYCKSSSALTLIRFPSQSFVVMRNSTDESHILNRPKMLFVVSIQFSMSNCDTCQV